MHQISVKRDSLYCELSNADIRLEMTRDDWRYAVWKATVWKNVMMRLLQINACALREEPRVRLELSEHTPTRRRIG